LLTRTRHLNALLIVAFLDVGLNHQTASKSRQ